MEKSCLNPSFQWWNSLAVIQVDGSRQLCSCVSWDLFGSFLMCVSPLPFPSVPDGPVSGCFNRVLLVSSSFVIETFLSETLSGVRDLDTWLNPTPICYWVTCPHFVACNFFRLKIRREKCLTFKNKEYIQALLKRTWKKKISIFFNFYYLQLII